MAELTPPDGRPSSDAPVASQVVMVPSELAQASLPSVLTAVAHDAKALVVAHVDSLRTDLGQRVDAVGSLVRASGAALVLGLVTAMLVAASLVISLIALGVPPWIASWAVTVPAALALLLPIARARRAGRATTAAPGEVAREMADEPVLTPEEP